MYCGFNLKLEPATQFPAGSYEIGQGIRDRDRERVEVALDAFVSPSGALDAAKMKARWFPEVRADVFISHSHADAKTAISLAGWLKAEFKLIAFVDSCVWGYADKLLRQIDDRFCYHEASGTYSYEKRNRSTSHVHMMLTTALADMMDTCECVLFLNTPASVLPSDVIGGGSAATLSPWLYLEIAMTRLLRRRGREDYRTPIEKRAADNIGEALNIQYAFGLDHLWGLDVEELKRWHWKWSQRAKVGIHALDLLYQLKGEC